MARPATVEYADLTDEQRKIVDAGLRSPGSSVLSCHGPASPTRNMVGYVGQTSEIVLVR